MRRAGQAAYWIDGIQSAAIVAAARTAALQALPGVSVWKVSKIIGLLCLVTWIARVKTVPYVSVSASGLVVRNCSR